MSPIRYTPQTPPAFISLVGDESPIDVVVSPIWKHFLEMPPPENILEFEDFYKKYRTLDSPVIHRTLDSPVIQTKRKSPTRPTKEGKNFLCPFDECESGFMRHKDLLRHLRNKHLDYYNANYKI